MSMTTKEQQLAIQELQEEWETDLPGTECEETGEILVLISKDDEEDQALWISRSGNAESLL